MSQELEFTKRTNDINNEFNVGGSNNVGDIVARTKCPFCNVRTAFRQIARGFHCESTGQMVGLFCDSCSGIVSCNIDKDVVYPSASVSGLEDDLPGDINKYYNEALRCIEADAPNGAATVFRKVIDATCIYYGLSGANQNDSFYDMIVKMSEEGLITESLRQSLLGVKDGGRDGAHINDQDPTMEQARNMKQMMDSVLSATVVAGQKVNEFREDHPNEFKQD